MSRHRLAMVLALLACSASVGIDGRAGNAVTHTVVIEGMQFKPAALTIRHGDSVIWVNKDIVEHTATTPASAKQQFDSARIPRGKSWTRRFTVVGKHMYLCTYHPTMTGAVTVSTRRAGITD